MTVNPLSLSGHIRPANGHALCTTCDVKKSLIISWCNAKRSCKWCLNENDRNKWHWITARKPPNFYPQNKRILGFWVNRDGGHIKFAKIHEVPARRLSNLYSVCSVASVNARRTKSCFYVRCILSRLHKGKGYGCKLFNSLDLCKHAGKTTFCSTQIGKTKTGLHRLPMWFLWLRRTIKSLHIIVLLLQAFIFFQAGTVTNPAIWLVLSAVRIFLSLTTVTVTLAWVFSVSF